MERVRMKATDGTRSDTEFVAPSPTVEHRSEVKTFQERGFPFAEFPIGWFQIGWSEEFTVGSPKPLRYFGCDLVAYRGDSGTVRVMDAHCQHLGAHLGYGGRIEGDDIVCPFHEWRWDASGANTEIPYSPGKCSHRKMRVWHVTENSGAVLVWYHPQNEAPSWEPPPLLMPEAEDDSFHHPYPHCTATEELQAPSQWVVENIVDIAHIKSVHRQNMPDFSKTPTSSEDEHIFTVVIDATLDSSKGTVPVIATNVAYGMGIVVNHLTGLLPTGQLQCVTPIDHTRSHLRFTLFVPRTSGAGRNDLPVGVSRAVVDAQMYEIFAADRDFPVWQHQIFMAKPGLVREEAQHYGKFRRWAHQFYLA